MRLLFGCLVLALVCASSGVGMLFQQLFQRWNTTPGPAGARPQEGLYGRRPPPSHARTPPSLRFCLDRMSPPPLSRSKTPCYPETSSFRMISECAIPTPTPMAHGGLGSCIAADYGTKITSAARSPSVAAPLRVASRRIAPTSSTPRLSSVYPERHTTRHDTRSGIVRPILHIP